MNKALITWQLISKSLQQQMAVMLLYVLQSHGSSPGRQGFFMAVDAAGDKEGSIGGGIMEHKFVEMAKEQLRTGGNDRIQIKKQYHNKSATANQSGMICSGEQTILLYRVQFHDANNINQLIDSLQHNKNGTLTLSPEGLQFNNRVPANDYYFEEGWLYREKTGYKHHLHIAGAGHCGLALSHCMQSMDFCVHIYDDRPDVKTLLQNCYAHDKQIIASYQQLQHLVPSGDDQYVVIMTMGYRTDDIAIRALWDKQFRYLGVLGSESKISKLFADYRAEGIPPAVLQKIRAPVGLAIHSQTPEEIAVSIAAEIIQIKNAPPCL